MRNIGNKVAPDLIELFQFGNIVKQHYRAACCVGALLDWDSADFDAALGVGLRIAQA